MTQLAEAILVDLSGSHNRFAWLGSDGLSDIYEETVAPWRASLATYLATHDIQRADWLGISIAGRATGVEGRITQRNEPISLNMAKNIFAFQNGSIVNDMAAAAAAVTWRDTDRLVLHRTAAECGDVGVLNIGSGLGLGLRRGSGEVWSTELGYAPAPWNVELAKVFDRNQILHQDVLSSCGLTTLARKFGLVDADASARIALDALAKAPSAADEHVSQALGSALRLLFYAAPGLGKIVLIGGGCRGLSPLLQRVDWSTVLPQGDHKAALAGIGLELDPRPFREIAGLAALYDAGGS